MTMWKGASLATPEQWWLLLLQMVSKNTLLIKSPTHVDVDTDGSSSYTDEVTVKNMTCGYLHPNLTNVRCLTGGIQTVEMGWT
jgi:hypothetical protein